jgi:hypothetical protein
MHQRNVKNRPPLAFVIDTLKVERPAYRELRV